RRAGRYRCRQSLRLPVTVRETSPDCLLPTGQADLPAASDPKSMGSVPWLISGRCPSGRAAPGFRSRPVRLGTAGLLRTLRIPNAATVTEKAAGRRHHPREMLVDFLTNPPHLRCVSLETTRPYPRTRFLNILRRRMT